GTIVKRPTELSGRPRSAPAPLGRARSYQRVPRRTGTNLAPAMRRFVLPGLIAVAAVALLALLTFCGTLQTDTSSIDSRVAQGKFPMAPNAHMSLPVLGSSVSRTLADFRGKVVVLNVFASWCQPCASEAPLLSREQPVLLKSDGTVLGVTYQD